MPINYFFLLMVGLLLSGPTSLAMIQETEKSALEVAQKQLEEELNGVEEKLEEVKDELDDGSTDSTLVLQVTTFLPRSFTWTAQEHHPVETSGMFFQAQLIWEDYSIPLIRHKNLHGLKKPEAIEVYIDNKLLELPVFLKEKILSFLIDGNTHESFDCNGFFHHVFGVPWIPEEFHEALWDYVKFIEEKIRVGEAVCLFDSKNKIKRHFAIYSGNGIYISKYLNSHGLTFSTLQEMHKLFSSDSVVIIEPRKA